jgi:chromosome segregation ATPase
MSTALVSSLMKTDYLKNLRNKLGNGEHVMEDDILSSIIKNLKTLIVGNESEEEWRKEEDNDEEDNDEEDNDEEVEDNDEEVEDNDEEVEDNDEEVEDNDEEVEDNDEEVEDNDEEVEDNDEEVEDKYLVLKQTVVITMISAYIVSLAVLIFHI